MRSLSKPLYILIYILVALIIFVSYFGLKFNKSTAKFFHCKDFSSQIEAQDAYNNGAKYLDGVNKYGIRNGIACDSSLPLSLK